MLAHYLQCERAYATGIGAKLEKGFYWTGTVKKEGERDRQQKQKGHGNIYGRVKNKTFIGEGNRRDK